MNTKAFFFVMLLFVFTISNAQTTALKKTKAQSSHPGATFFNGAWQGTIGEFKTFSVMHDGYFNITSIDLTGKWDSGDAGSYTVNKDSTITFKILYSSDPNHVGIANTAAYAISGETVRMWHFKKMIDAEGNDITDQMPRNFVEKMTRLK